MKVRWAALPICSALVIVAGFRIGAAYARALRESVTTLGIALVAIKPGSFVMGSDERPLPAVLLNGRGLEVSRPVDGDFDEHPAHRVTITNPFLISATEVTIRQFQQFDPGFKGNVEYAPYASGISWDRANAFCNWLSHKEGKTYRLPTEAEWEYACRAGTTTPFSSGNEPPTLETANPWEVKNMNAGVAEWVADWYGSYPSLPQIDPVGPASGIAKVIRGGGLDDRDQKGEEHTGHFPAELAYYARSANRASLAPSFDSASARIGFRVVQAPFPQTKPLPVQPLFFETAVKQQATAITQGPDPSKPFFQKRLLFPDIGDRPMRTLGWKIGLTQGLGIAYHNSAVQVMPNGDLLAAYYNTPEKEDDPDQSILTMRLRYGTNDWDLPEAWPDFADAADAAPVIWNEHGNIWFFWGSPRLLGAYPFQYMQSSDNGATWSAVTYPNLVGPVGKFTPQPINSVVRTGDGTIYLPTDATGGKSVLWATRDDGTTWFDTGGRTGGRHTTLVIGEDGSLIGFGGKNTNIEGFMPVAVSRDGGKTYQITKTTLTPLGNGQRPSVIRLASGRLFFVGDSFTAKSKIAGARREGSYVALSNDDGNTWTKRELPAEIKTVGYTTATQGPNGIIHMVTSKNKPDYEIELNEAWALQGGPELAPAIAVSKVKSYREDYPDGRPKVTWTAGIGNDGCYLLDGVQTFYYENGNKQWQATFIAGEKHGTEAFWSEGGRKLWMREYASGGFWRWTLFDDAGRVKATSEWKGMILQNAYVSTLTAGRLRDAPGASLPGE
jgi:formylglycine-generating enzyme required for sulfatase activity